MALFYLNRAIGVRLATSICYDTLIRNCFEDWSQSKQPRTQSAFPDSILLFKGLMNPDVIVRTFFHLVSACGTICRKSSLDPAFKKGVQRQASN